MPFIDQANIACGGHAGDAHSVANTVALAQKLDVAIGAHPSYPDKENFGRISHDIAIANLRPILTEQIQLVAEQAPLHHIKAHGALYNDCATKSELLELLMELAAEFECKLMLQAFADMSAIKALAKPYNIELIYEGFADRAYAADGKLVSRKENGAVLQTVPDILKQAECFRNGKNIISNSGSPLKLDVHSLCVHGDNPLAFEALKKIHHAFH